MFNKKNLEVAKLASKEAGRYTINGVLVCNEGTIATDGHILGHVGPIVSETMDRPFAPFVLDAKTVEQVAKTMNGGSVYVDTPNQLHCETKMGSRAVDASQDWKAENFPNWKAVMPALEATTFKVSFDPKLLIKALTLMQGYTCTLSFKDADSALRIDAKTEDGQTITALVMPKRLER